MNEKTNTPPETLAAILAEMRDGIHTGRADIIDCVNDRLRSYADRLDAAAKREHAEIRRDAEIGWTRIGYDERKAEEKRAPGNASAMREALEKARSNIAACRMFLAWKSREDELLMEVHKSIDAALAAPARNCDQFATHNDARAAFLRTYFGPTEPEFVEAAFAAWLFDTAKGGAE